MCEGLVIDSAGFSSVEFIGENVFLAKDIQFCFNEFKEHIDNCKFNGCTHIKTKGCAIIDAVENGEISISRYESYVSMFDELKDIKSWQI